MSQDPFVSVVVRSYMRPDAMLELVARCQAQDYPTFEVVVIEQSVGVRDAFAERFAHAELDPRVRILLYPKLGYIGARNEGIRQSKGEVILFMDDDDLPIGTRWIAAHARNYRDPLCVAVIGRETEVEDEDPKRFDSRRAHRMTLRYSSLLKIPSARNRHSKRIVGVQSIKGGGCSIRRSAIDRVGLWDENVVGLSHEERYFDFRFARLKRPGEHYVYDPDAAMLRRKDVAGGMERRVQPVDKILYEELYYSHKVIRTFFPTRFVLLYPAYVAMHAARTVLWFREAQPEKPMRKVLWELGKALIPTIAKAWR